jgi:hypothetical protein
MARAKTKSPWRALLRLAWQQPLWALPFAIFFGTIFGGSGLASYWMAYRMSLVFACSVNLCLWVAEYFVAPRVLAEDESKIPLWQHGALYGGSSIFGSLLAAVILNFTLVPGFLGGPRQWLVVGMFTLLFVVLFSAISYAITFYRKSLDRARADQELVLARRIQRSFLLSSFPAMPRLEVHAANISSKQVSGDFYDVVPAGENAFLLAIADVAGKGVPAALLSSMLQASLRTQANTIASVAAILKNINTLVYRSTAVHQFATFFLARVEEDSLSMSFSNAGHNFPVVFRKGGERILLERGGTMVGILEGAEFEEDAVKLHPGDRVIFYTDGINEAADGTGQQFGEDRLYDTVARLAPDLPASGIVEAILQSVRAFLDGEEPGDDMTVMALRVLEPVPAASGNRAPTALNI